MNKLGVIANFISLKETEEFRTHYFSVKWILFLSWGELTELESHLVNLPLAITANKEDKFPQSLPSQVRLKLSLNRQPVALPTTKHFIDFHFVGNSSSDKVLKLSIIARAHLGLFTMIPKKLYTKLQILSYRIWAGTIILC